MTMPHYADPNKASVGGGASVTPGAAQANGALPVASPVGQPSVPAANVAPPVVPAANAAPPVAPASAKFKRLVVPPTQEPVKDADGLGRCQHPPDALYVPRIWCQEHC